MTSPISITVPTDPTITIEVTAPDAVDVAIDNGITDAPIDGSYYARRNAAWSVLGSMALQVASAVAILGGTIDGTILGGTSPAVAHVTTLSATGPITSTQATGTAPFSVLSTTLVPNLYVARAALADLASEAIFADTVITNADLTGPITSVGNATSVAAQTGTGSTFVMNMSPTLVTPDLGTPSAGVMTNATGTAAGLTAGHVTTNANLTGPITSVGNATSVAAQTGTGSTFVMQGSPALTTPDIGAATGSSLSVSGQLVSTVVTGTAPLVVSSATNVPNLYASRATLADNVTTNANLTGPITSVGNATSVATQTGTGTTFVMNTSPTLVTPVIGVATGTSLAVTGQLTSSVVTGTAPLVVASTTVVANLNVSALLGATWAAPAAIGTGTPAAGTFTQVTDGALTPTWVVYAGTAGLLSGDAGFVRSALSLSVDSDSDALLIAGNARMGFAPSGTAGTAYWYNGAISSPNGNYAMRQTSNGATTGINAVTNVLLAIGNTTKAALTTSGFTFSAGVPVTASDTTDGTSGSAGAFNTLGGVGITKALWVGTNVTIANGTHTQTITDAITNTTTGMMVINHLSSGTVANGFGTSINFNGHDDGATNRAMGTLAWTWIDAASATRTAKFVVNVTGNAANVGAMSVTPTTVTHVSSDAATSSVTLVASFQHVSSGTAANGFGNSIQITGPDDGGSARAMALISTSWTTAASATRASKISFSVQTAAVLTVGLSLTSTALNVSAGFPANFADTTDSTTGGTGAINTLGGIGITKALFVGTNITWANGSVNGTLTDGGTTTTPSLITIIHKSSGTAANGFGSTIQFSGDDDGAATRAQAQIVASWTTAASATRSSKIVFNVINSTANTTAFTLAGTSATFASGFPVTISDTTASTTTAGALLIGTGTAATSVTFGGGNGNVGGTLTVAGVLSGSSNFSTLGRIIASGTQTTATTTGNVAFWRSGGTYLGTTAGDMVFQTDLVGNRDYIFTAGVTTPAIVLKIAALGDITASLGNLIFNTVGKGIQIKSGTGTRLGNATLVAGTVTVTNTNVTANSVILLTRKTSGGTIGTSITYTLSAGASFTINSDNPLDTSTFSYHILESI